MWAEFSKQGEGDRGTEGNFRSRGERDRAIFIVSDVAPGDMKTELVFFPLTLSLSKGELSLSKGELVEGCEDPLSAPAAARAITPTDSTSATP
jgi:hypothetical protein